MYVKGCTYVYVCPKEREWHENKTKRKAATSSVSGPQYELEARHLSLETLEAPWV